MLPKPYSLIVLLLMGACYPERAQNATATTDVDTPPNQNESPNDRPVGARDGGLQNSSDAEQLDAGLPLGFPPLRKFMTISPPYAALVTARVKAFQFLPL